MAMWIAFDQETSSFLHTRLAQGTKIATLRRGPVDYALAKPGSVVTLLPEADGDIGIAIFRRRGARKAVSPVAPQSIASGPTRATGFLGLGDEPAFAEEPEQKKSWWQKLWDE